MKRLSVIFFIVLVAVAASLYVGRVKVREVYEDVTKPILPQAITLDELAATSVSSATPPIPPSADGGTSPLLVKGGIAQEPSAPLEPPAPHEPFAPLSFNLAVPFTPQAPHGNWALPFQEACEEVSIYMAHLYLEGEPEGLVEAGIADKEIIKIIQFENVLFGDYKDTTAAQTATVLEQMYGHTFKLIEDPTVDDIKAHIAAGHPVIVPAAGRQLKNPYFRNEGPLYHMLVIRGYTDTHFITNDPGTRRGEGYLYSFDRIMSAMHDWNNGDVENGAKVVIVVYPDR